MLATPGGVDDFDGPSEGALGAAFWFGHWQPVLNTYSEKARELSANYWFSRDREYKPKFIQSVSWSGFPGQIDAWLQGELDWEQRANQSGELHRSIHGVSFDGDVDLSVAGSVFNHSALFRFGPNGSRVLTDVHCRQQDEYLEWRVNFGDSGRPRSVAFTAEPQEYWQVLHRFDPERVHRLYEGLLGTQIPPTDLVWPFDVYCKGQRVSDPPLFEAGSYNPYNPWNVEKGIVHLTHPDNLLAGQFYLLARAANAVVPVPLEPVGESIGKLLIAKTRNGSGVNRTSDPMIAANAYQLARRGMRLSLWSGRPHPLGVYIRSVDLSGTRCLTVPSETLRWSVSRGLSNRPVRILVEPSRADLHLDDFEIDGYQIDTGSVVSRKIHLAVDVDVHVRQEGELVRHPGRPAFAASNPLHDTNFDVDRDPLFWQRIAPKIVP